MRSTARGARLLEASAGDVEHADRVDHVLADIRDHSAEVISLPRRPYDFEAAAAAPELEHDSRSDVLGSWLVAAGLGIGAWAIFAAIAYAVYAIVEAIT